MYWNHLLCKWFQIASSEVLKSVPNCYDEVRFPTTTSKVWAVTLMKNDIESLSYTRWKCKHHIVFAAKYRRQIVYGKYKESIGKIIR